MDVKNYYASTGISLGDGDGAGGLDTVNDASGLDAFPIHSFVKILTNDGNNNSLVKVISSSATKLEVPSDSFTSLAAGSSVVLLRYDIGGCLRNIFRNYTIHLFAEARPASADDAEPGSPVCKITLNGASFNPGEPLNGLNFGEVEGGLLRRAIDPETGASEITRGDPLSDSVVQSARLYTNDVVTGASISAPRIDFTVTGQNGGGDIILKTGTQLSVGTPVDVTSIKIMLDSIPFTG
jgi:hypothetical protein